MKYAFFLVLLALVVGCRIELPEKEEETPIVYTIQELNCEREVVASYTTTEYRFAYESDWIRFYDRESSTYHYFFDDYGHMTFEGEPTYSGDSDSLTYVVEELNCEREIVRTYRVPGYKVPYESNWIRFVDEESGVKYWLLKSIRIRRITPHVKE